MKINIRVSIQYRKIFPLLVGMTLTANVMAIDLMQTYMEALSSDPQYASARSALTAGQEKSTQGLAKLLPSVGMSGSWTHNDIEKTNYNENKYGVSLTQPIFNWANYQNYENSKLSVALSQAQFEQAKQDLMVRVAKAYFDVLTAQDVLNFAQSQKLAVSRQLEQAKRNFQVGTVTITDTHEAQARYDLADADEIAATNDLEVARSALEQIIGHEPSQLDPLRKNVPLDPPQPNVMSDWVDASRQQNYVVAQYRLSKEIAKRNIQVAKSGHYPTVDFVASYNHTNHDQYTVSNKGAFSSFNDTKVAGIQWNIPLFSGMETTSKVREAVALDEKARNDYENALRTAAQQSRQYFLSVNNGLAKVKALQAAERSSLSALASNKLGYEVGVRINIDVLDAEQQVFKTKRDLTIARHETIVNNLKLKQSAGSLVEEDIQEVNLLLEK